jgi:hypothetical protein
MAGEAAEPQGRVPRRDCVEPLGLADRDAELALARTCGDLGVAARADFRVDPDGDRRCPAGLGGQAGEQGQLGLGLDVDLADAALEGEGEFRGRLADAGKDDPLRRHAGGQGAADLPFRDRVGPGAQARERRQHGEAGVGLDREGDQGAGELGVALESLDEHPEVPLEGRGRVDIDWRADGRGDGRERRPLAPQGAVAGLEVVHSGGRA